MGLWVCRLLPWAVFIPSILVINQIGIQWAFALGIVNGGFACFCGMVADDLKKRGRA